MAVHRRGSPHWAAIPVKLTTALLAAGILAGPCLAQSNPAAVPSGSLIHLDGPGVQAARSWHGFLEGRFFSGNEDIAYGGIGIFTGLNSRLEAGIRAVFAERKSLALPGGNTIDHGGNDVELLARYGL